MKLSRRILSAFLAFLMVCSLCIVVGAANVTFTDVSGHWAWTGGQIQYLVDKGVLNGYKQTNGTYKFVPDGQVTRAEFIKMLDETFGLTETASINFSDVKSSDWFYPYFAKAKAQGYLLNYGTYADPNGKITREEALSLLVRYLDLPANEKADTSYFKDYYSISENYRDYVLRGIYAGLTDGYNENGAKYFKPKNTLTRAEALTILYRAAGSIFNVNAYSRDSMAAATNNVITRGGVILNGITLHGRVIISEGATSGTVALTGCSADTLYIRGTADVTLDNCKIKNIIITKGCKVSLFNRTEVDNLTVYGKSAVGIYSGISVDVLNVENSASGTSVTGDGAIKKANINASGFSSSMVPTEFRIGNNLTATFSGNQYEGSSDAQDSFTMTPFVTSDGSNYYLNLLPAVSGKVYYYFTNGANAPTTADYDSYYAASSYTGMITVKNGEMKTEKTYAASSVKNYEYVVLQLQEDGRKYAPVVIPNTNTDGTGFSVDPYLADETTIKGKSAEAGTVYWYYSKSGEKMTQAEFLQNYAKADKELRGNGSVTSLNTFSIALSTKYLTNYKYIVLMVQNYAGSYYTPVVVSAGDTGFAVAPAVKNVGTVSYKASVAGELYYYYAENSSLPAAEDYKAEYNRAEYAERFDIKKNTAATFEYKVSRSEDYPYLIIAIKNSDGDWMQPVALNINYQTGFRNSPEVYDETTIKFRTEDDGEVMYYYSKTETAPSAEAFNTAYNAAGKDYRDTVDVDDSWESIKYSQSKAVAYPYMVFMFIDDQDNEYAPVVVALNATSNDGFKIAPYVIGDTVYFTTLEDGEVWYFYAKTNDVVASSEFEDDYDSAREYGQKYATAGKLTSFELEDDDVLEKYPYLVLSFLPEEYENKDDKVFRYPVILDVEKSGASGSALTVDSVDDEEVWITAGADGRVYYYFTDSSSNPGTKFEDKYDAASSSKKDYETCEENEKIGIDVEDVNYGYLIICLAVADGSDEVFLAPIVVDLKNHTSGAGDTDDGSTTSSIGLTVKNFDQRNHTITFVPSVSGTVKITLSAGNLITPASETISVTKNVEAEFDYDFFMSSDIINWIIQTSGTGVKLTLQLTSGDEVYRSVSYDVIE